MDFYKYQATGNDFIILDNRLGRWNKVSVSQWALYCDRKLGIGADGVLLVEEVGTHSDRKISADYRMRYLNADGREVAMCGNGLRAFTHFIHFYLPGADSQSRYLTGLKSSSQYRIQLKNQIYQSYVSSQGQISIEMVELYDQNAVDVQDLKCPEAQSFYYVNTGVPHVVIEVEQVEQVDVVKVGKVIHDDPRFALTQGVNVNFVQVVKNGDKSSEIKVRTFERGVLGETLSCGTGVVAAVYGQSLKKKNQRGTQSVVVSTLGGTLIVSYEGAFQKVTLSGPVSAVFQGNFLEVEK